MGSVSGDNFPETFDWGKLFGGNAIIEVAGASGVVSPFVGVLGTVDATGQRGGGDETHGCGDRCCCWIATGSSTAAAELFRIKAGEISPERKNQAHI